MLWISFYELFLDDIVLNLHGTIGKTSAQRCIDKLIADGEILEKVYGKQSVYVIQQVCR